MQAKNILISTWLGAAKQSGQADKLALQIIFPANCCFRPDAQGLSIGKKVIKLCIECRCVKQDRGKDVVGRMQCRVKLEVRAERKELPVINDYWKTSPCLSIYTKEKGQHYWRVIFTNTGMEYVHTRASSLYSFILDTSLWEMVCYNQRSFRWKNSVGSHTSSGRHGVQNAETQKCWFGFCLQNLKKQALQTAGVVASCSRYAGHESVEIVENPFFLVAPVHSIRGQIHASTVLCIKLEICWQYLFICGYVGSREANLFRSIFDIQQCVCAIVCMMQIVFSASCLAHTWGISKEGSGGSFSLVWCVSVISGEPCEASLVTVLVSCKQNGLLREGIQRWCCDSVLGTMQDWLPGDGRANSDKEGRIWHCAKFLWRDGAEICASWSSQEGCWSSVGTCAEEMIGPFSGWVAEVV